MSKQIVSQKRHDVKDVLERIKAVGERNRREYEALARMTGLTIAEIEADLTAPDPGLEKEECAVEWCGEPAFRFGLCFEHFVKEERTLWDDQDAERLTCLLGVGYFVGDFVEGVRG